MSNDIKNDASIVAINLGELLQEVEGGANETIPLEVQALLRTLAEFKVPEKINLPLIEIVQKSGAIASWVAIQDAKKEQKLISEEQFNVSIKEAEKEGGVLLREAHASLIGIISKAILFSINAYKNNTWHYVVEKEYPVVNDQTKYIDVLCLFNNDALQVCRYKDDAFYDLATGEKCHNIVAWQTIHKPKTASEVVFSKTIN